MDQLALLQTELRHDPERGELEVRIRVTGAPASISELSQVLRDCRPAAIAGKLASALGSSYSAQYGVAGHPYRGFDPRCKQILESGSECRRPLGDHCAV